MRKREAMTQKDRKFPDPKEIEKEISQFLSEKFGGRVKLISPVVIPAEAPDQKEEKPRKQKKIDFSLKPEELEAYLDQYVVKQSEAKAILATKICTHFHRIKQARSSNGEDDAIVGNIKNNILMIGPTGVGKTYMIKLIADKIGVPMVKGDATKFSETGYVGGDVEDLVRDLVREADNDIKLAQYGIIYIDEIDKIASSRNLVGPDVSRTGVQRALLKPMEETDIDLRVPHDPISMLEEIERYRKTGKRKKHYINTKNILFIMSGAFNDLAGIIKKRMVDQGIGFGAAIRSRSDSIEYLKHVKPEDLIKYGFESEFIGRLPVISVFEKLTEDDLFAILKNPNNPIILSKKLDFKAYNIAVKFDDGALREIARLAYKDGTGARGLTSVIEKILIKLEKRLPSTGIKKVPVTEEVVKDPESALKKILSVSNRSWREKTYEKLAQQEKESIKRYVTHHSAMLTEKYGIELTPSRIDLIAEIYGSGTSDVAAVIKKIKNYRDQIKNMEAYFHKTHALNIILDQDCIDLIILRMNSSPTALGEFYKELTSKFEYGFKLIRDRTGQTTFVITKEGLENPQQFLDDLVKESYVKDDPS